MGNNSSSRHSTCTLTGPTSLCQASQNTSGKNHTNTLAFIFNESIQHKLTLLNFQAFLTTPECFYVLSSLLQQYYSIFKVRGTACVSARSCLVNEFGQIKVQQNWEDLQKRIYAISLVSILSQIVELVEGLAKQSDGMMMDRGYSYFHSKMLKIIYRLHHNQDMLYRQLIEELFTYMECNQYRCNLLPALIRINQPPQQKMLKRKQSLKRIEVSSFETFIKVNRNSTMHNAAMNWKQNYVKGENNNKKSLACNRKLTRTQGEEDYHNASQNQQLFQERSIIQDYTTNQNQHHRYISSQYSMSIANANQRRHPQSKSKVKFNNLTHKMQYEQQNSDHFQRSMKRNHTTSGFFCQQSGSKGHAKTKSLLEDLARSVIVKDISSKSIIF